MSNDKEYEIDKDTENEIALLDKLMDKYNEQYTDLMKKKINSEIAGDRILTNHYIDFLGDLQSKIDDLDNKYREIILRP